MSPYKKSTPDNWVYIGFDPLPVDWKTIICAAAIKGNRAIDFGCHVYAAEAGPDAQTYGEWKSGPGRYYKSITARYGKIDDWCTGDQ